MIEIGKSRLVTVKVKNKRTGKLVPKIGSDGKPEQKLKESNVWRVTRDALDGTFGRDRGRRLVVGIVGVDQLVFRPQGTRQEVRLNIDDAYSIALQRRANLAVLERARARKVANAERLEAARIVREEKRIRAAARRDNRES